VVENTQGWSPVHSSRNLGNARGKVSKWQLEQ